MVLFVVFVGVLEVVVDLIGIDEVVVLVFGMTFVPLLVVVVVGAYFYSVGGSATPRPPPLPLRVLLLPPRSRPRLCSWSHVEPFYDIVVLKLSPV